MHIRFLVPVQLPLSDRTVVLCNVLQPRLVDELQVRARDLMYVFPVEVICSTTFRLIIELELMCPK